MNNVQTIQALLCLDGIPMDIEASDIKLVGHPRTFLVTGWKAFTKLLLMQMRGKRFHFIDDQKRRASADYILESVESMRLYENDSLLCTFRPAPRNFLERFGL